MSVASYILGIVSAALILIVVIEMLRRHRLRERHAIWWVIAGILALIIGIFPKTLDWAAGVLGIQVPTNLVFFVGIALLFLVALQSSSELTKLESKTRTLAEQVTLLELRIRELEDRGEATPPAAPSAPSSARKPRARKPSTPQE
jgi:hypothetical protein